MWNGTMPIVLLSLLMADGCSTSSETARPYLYEYVILID
jgi:hypothetical protein